MKFHTLIASDVDGTLIPEETTEMPQAVLDAVADAWERGYLFVAASGRQYPSLRALFAPVADKMAFLIENGSGIYYQEKLLYAKTLDREHILEMVRFVDAQPECEWLADGAGNSCARPKGNNFVYQLEQVQKLQVHYINSYDQIPDQVMKIAVWCPTGSERFEMPFRAKFGHCSRVAVSGADWIDFSASDKGAGLEKACELFDIPESYTIAFGDNWNDQTMLDFAAHPYIMATAAEALRSRYANVCRNVPEELKKFFGN